MRAGLARWRWRLMIAAAALVGIRVIIAIALRMLRSGPAELSGWIPIALAALDAISLLLIVAAIVGFVLYGRIYNARVPTE